MRLLCASTALAATVVLLSAPSSFAFGDSNASIHGYMDLVYKQASEPEGIFASNAGDPTNGSFDLRHFNFLMDVKILPELRVKGQIEYDHGPDTERGLGGIILEYAFGEYTVTDNLTIRAGKTLTPYGIYNELHDATPAFLSVDISESIYKSNMQGGFAMFPKWSTGLAVVGQLPLLSGLELIEYTLYIGNGESLLGTNDSQYDDNLNKGVGGRINFVGDDSIFEAGVSIYYGDKAVTEDNLDERHLAAIFSIEANIDDINIHGEYAYSELGEKEQKAWYIQASYRFGRLTPYIRYQTLDPQADVDNDEWNTILGGVNYSINDNLFLKLEWNEHSREDNNLGVIDEGNESFSEVRTALTLFF